jgi:hypothetical protein
MLKNPLLKIALVFTTAVWRSRRLANQSLAPRKAAAARPNRRSWAKIGLQNLAYNIRRLVTLERMAAA